MRPQGRTAEQDLVLIARAQHGVVRRAQLLRAGVSAREIRHRLKTGALLREHRGVYRVGHRAPSREATYLAAVLACGQGAVLSGRAAAHLLGLIKGSAPAPEVTAPTERRIRGVRTRRSRGTDANDATTWRAIPVTTVARTLVDLAAVLTLDELARACHEAGVRHGTTPGQVEAVLVRRQNSPGSARLREVLRGQVRVTLSKLERKFLERLREAGAATAGDQPASRRKAGGLPLARAAIDRGARRLPLSPFPRERDRRREREARARGDDFRRFTYGDVFDAPQFMLSELRALLACH